MEMNDQTLKKLALPAGITAAGVAAVLAITKGGKDIGSFVSGLGDRNGSSGGSGSRSPEGSGRAGDGRQNDGRTSKPRRLSAAELAKRQKARAERRTQRRKKLKT